MKIVLVFMILGIGLTTSCKDNQQIELIEFPGLEYKKIVAFKMNGEHGLVVEDGQISQKTVGEGEPLSEEEEDKLLRIFSDESTYGVVVAACFDPHVGYVFYNKDIEIVAHSTVCLACNRMKTSPNIGESILSRRGNRKLARIEDKIFKH